MTQFARRAALGLAVTASLLLPAAAFAHGVASKEYEADISGLAPKGFPIDVRVVNDDQLRIENVGDGELMICGYDTEDGKCEEYVRIDEKGVFVNHDTSSYYANLDEEQYGDVPDDVKSFGPPDFQRLRERPLFYTYHDHRIHWMGGKTLPPGVDDSDPKRQVVSDFTVDLRYDGKPVTVNGTMYYVGGRTFVQRYGEIAVTGGAVLAMLIVFFVDWRRRRARRLAAAAAAGEDTTASVPETVDGATVLPAPDRTKRTEGET